MEPEVLKEHYLHGATILSLGLRYFFIAGLTYFVFYIWKRKFYQSSRIQWKYPQNKQIYREIFYSVISVSIFGLMTSFAIWADVHGYSLGYKNISDYGWAYFFFSIVIMIFIHDAYFYWTHRMLHWKPLFKTIHKVHHLSVNPSPFAAFAFHPVEGFIEALIMPILAFIIPHHFSAVIIFTSYSVLLNVLGHLGYELMPRYFARHWLFKWHNSSTHHNMHHTQVKFNFGLYFNIWDRLLKTNHQKYEERFEAIADQRERLKSIGKGRHALAPLFKSDLPVLAEVDNAAVVELANK